MCYFVEFEGWRNVRKIRDGIRRSYSNVVKNL